MPNIAISYRRSDSSAMAGRIFDHLTAHYGENAVFMDIDNIPFGIDFRSHIREVLVRTDVLIAVMGANWIGLDAAGNKRMQENADPVRVEIETALEWHKPIIPVLVDGAKMPQSVDLPVTLGNFSFLNAAEVSSGRDFRVHMDRLIGAIDVTLAGGTPTVSKYPHSGQMRAAAANARAQIQRRWSFDAAWYFVVPLVILLVAHHLIVNALNLNTIYLEISSSLIPFAFGFAFFWFARRTTGPASGVAILLGAVGVVAMTVSQSLYSGDPIMPQTRFEWWDNANYAVIITLSFVAGNATARLVRLMMS